MTDLEILSAITTDFFACKMALLESSWRCVETPLGGSEVIWTIPTPVGSVEVSSSVMQALREIQTDLFLGIPQRGIQENGTF